MISHIRLLMLAILPNSGARISSSHAMKLNQLTSTHFFYLLPFFMYKGLIILGSFFRVFLTLYYITEGYF